MSKVKRYSGYNWMQYKITALKCLQCGKKVLPGNRHYYILDRLNSRIDAGDNGLTHGYCSLKCLRTNETIKSMQIIGKL